MVEGVKQGSEISGIRNLGSGRVEMVEDV